jgi:hypothetical protein
MNTCSTTLTGYNYSRCADAGNGGVKELYIALRSDLANTAGQDYDGAVTVTDGAISAINLAESQTTPFHRFKFKRETTAMTSTAEINDNGSSSWSTEISIVFPRMSTAKRTSMMQLFLADTVVIVRDANDEYHYLGIDYAVNASAGGAETGTAIADANQYTLTLTDVAYQAPYLLTTAAVTALAAMVDDEEE